MSAAGRAHRVVPAAVIGLFIAPAALADPFAVINALRSDGCGREPGALASVRPDRRLNDVARALSRGDGLEAALKRIGYRAASSASFHVHGSREDGVIRQMLARRSCPSILDPRYDEAGFYRNGVDTWIVLAVREVSKPPLQPADVAERVLALVNAARAEPRDCGSERFGAARALSLSPPLNAAALSHALDMAEHGLLSHEGSDGTQSGERIRLAGYQWRASGENVASGQRDADAVVAAWLASPGHCATLMGPYFTEMGIAFALAPGKNPAIYWTQDFAAPQQ